MVEIHYFSFKKNIKTKNKNSTVTKAKFITILKIEII